MDGTELDLNAAEPGGPCGVWLDEDGHPSVAFKRG